MQVEERVVGGTAARRSTEGKEKTNCDYLEDKKEKRLEEEAGWKWEDRRKGQRENKEGRE